MPRDGSASTRAERLIYAVKYGRSIDPTVGSDAGDKKRKAGKRAQRIIIFPNAGSALRHHVAEVRSAGRALPSVRLQLKAHPPASDPMDRSQSTPITPITRTSDPAASARRASIARLGQQTDIRTMIDLGHVVRQARRVQDLTQSDVASLAGTGRRFISELEAGKATLEIERVLKVCEVVGIRLNATIDADDA